MLPPSLGLTSLWPWLKKKKKNKCTKIMKAHLTQNKKFYLCIQAHHQLVRPKATSRVTHTATSISRQIRVRGVHVWPSKGHDDSLQWRLPSVLFEWWSYCVTVTQTVFYLHRGQWVLSSSAGWRWAFPPLPCPLPRVRQSLSSLTWTATGGVSHRSQVKAA